MKICWVFTVLPVCFIVCGSAGAASRLQFAASSCSVTEGAVRLLVPIQRQGDIETAVNVELATVAGTAMPGVNYLETIAAVSFKGGETQQTVSIPILNDGLVGTTRTFRALLRQPSAGAELGPRATLTVAILDNDKGIHFYPGPISVSENARHVNVKVARGNDGDQSIGVDYATSDETAKAGANYLATSGSLTFAPGEVIKSINVPIFNDHQAGPSRTFGITLSNPTGDGVLGTPATVHVSILDGHRRMLQLDAVKYAVLEDADFVQIGVVRNGSDAPDTVDFYTTDATAKAGATYMGVTNTLQFAVGENRKSIRIPILNNAVNDPGKTFRVTLRNPTEGAGLGTPTSALVTIFDNDPGVGFSAGTFWATEETGLSTVTVTRGGDERLGSFTVDYQTEDGTAKAGADYQAVSGTLRFEPNQALNAVTIPILRNPASKGIKTLKVQLMNTTAGIALSRQTTQVKILGSKGYYPIVPQLAAESAFEGGNGIHLLSWERDGMVKWTDRVGGPWEDLPRITSPYAHRPTSPAGFYRIQSPRSTEVYVPSGYDGHTPLPLILMLHALGGDGPGMIGYWPEFPRLADARGFFLCFPSGLVDAEGRGFWNGPDYLSFSGAEVDDSGYLRGVIEEIQRRFAVDPKRIHVAGYSSGGAMSHRLACEHADLIAGIASLSGGTYYSPNECHPSEPVHVLQISAGNDVYLGGTLLGDLPVVGELPGAFGIVQRWAGFNGCRDPVVDAVPSMDLTFDVDGVETTVLRYAECPPGGAVELWTVNGADHYWGVSDTPQCLALFVDWLLAHPKP